MDHTGGRVKRCYNAYEARMYLGVDASFFDEQIAPYLTWIPAGRSRVVEVDDIDNAWDGYLSRLDGEGDPERPNS